MARPCEECIRQHGPHYSGECEHGTRTGEFASETELFWLALGFEREGTGGNCDAYRMNLPSGRYILVTLAEDAQAPDRMDDEINISLHGPDDGTDASSEAIDAFFAYDSEQGESMLLDRFETDPQWSREA